MSLISDLFIIIGSQALLFFIGHWYCRHVLCGNEEIPNRHSEILFASTFSLCCILLLLVVFEIIDILAREFRLLVWKSALYLVTLLLVVFIPNNIAELAIRKLSFKNRKFANMVLWFTWLIIIYCFYKLLGPLPVTHGQTSLWSIESIVSRVGVIGVLMVATMAGFGAVNCLYTSLPCFIQRVPEDYAEKVERQIGKTFEMIAAKKLRTLDAADVSEPLGKKQSLFNLFGASTSSLVDNEVLEEIKSLEAFNERLFMEYVEINAINRQKAYAKTLRGKYFIFVGYVLSLLSSWKMVSSIINIVFDRYGTVDPVTRVITIAVHYMGFDFDVKFYSQNFSFVFVGLLSLCSVRTLLVNFAKLFSIFNPGRLSNISILLTTEVMGMYLLSSVLLVRMSIPAEYRWIITEVFGNLAYPFYHRWFDEIFILSVMASTAFFVIVHKKYNFKKCE
uniref:Abscisic acid G-protein coupled receptor-like domain-containing protein n=1 Tax=Trichuris muris TaxID=70415 RepID=A0A5S6QP79_TRIMR